MVHFLLITLPAQGHINPTLQFAKRLTRLGAHVTFVTSVYGHRLMIKPTTPIDGLSYATFSDGFDDGFTPLQDLEEYEAKIKEVGSRTLSDLIHALANEGRPVTCVVYAILIPWVADVANKLDIPSVLLWIQPATVFAIYYHYFHGYDSVIKKSSNDPSALIELPGLPPITLQDLPSFLLPSSPNTFPTILLKFKEQFEILDKQAKPTRVLVNTYDSLEAQALTSVDGMDMVGIGPLIPSAFLDRKDPSDTSFGADMFQHTADYIEWLDSKPKASVVYISFGSLSVLSEQQMEEISRGLKEANRPFLWVVRKTKNDTETETDVSERFGDGKEGLVVPWCSQVEVLSHPSVGCFLTHCGWNSTLESLAMGVPVVGFPQWTDQTTIANLMEGACKKGVRARVNKEGVLEGDELKRCLDLVMGDGEKGKEIRKNCVKWRDLAREAVNDGGLSDQNIREFVAEGSEGRF
eukprot:TRINITY_DN1733_c1_g1_i4.p1 TRINITY_DN1733_c1_g1~~TRINITY_DN1733_c1_g1_i4.p1  ORF type:complete len:465 (+),score=51.18 TRINITY_DN1733_c1_g1_i4:403-1797(+)